MERTMSFNDWVTEYKPVEEDSLIYEISSMPLDPKIYPKWDDLIKKATDLIGKYLIIISPDTYPDDHISMVYIEKSATSRCSFWYVVTKKPMNDINRIIIKEQLDDKCTMSLYNFNWLRTIR